MSKLSLSHTVGGSPTYVDDVFSAYTYTGNGSTQTITNGIDLAGKGGMVWLKQRNGENTNRILGTGVTSGNVLQTSTTDGFVASAPGSLTLLNNGLSFNSSSPAYNQSSDTYVSWTFRKAPKFFDVVTYTGDGIVDRAIPHNLGIAAGLILIKPTSTTGNWRASINGYHMWFNTSDAYSALTLEGGTPSTNTTSLLLSQYLSTGVSAINANGVSYVAYLFAHNTAANGLIQCGNFTTDATGAASVTLGWEPQFVLCKITTATSSWFVNDSMRSWPIDSNGNYLLTNTSGAEVAGGGLPRPTATGFVLSSSTPSATFVYMAIRRPNKPPTTGTQVYNAIARTGTGAAATVTGAGFAPDILLSYGRTSSLTTVWFDRLRGATKALEGHTYSVESSSTQSVTSFDMNGVSLGTSTQVNGNTSNYIYWMFKRSIGVVDTVCYTGTGSLMTISHNLGVQPELIISRCRTSADYWDVGFKNGTQWSKGTSWGSFSLDTLNNTITTGAISAGLTSTTFYSTDTAGGPAHLLNQSYITYLFASKSGISKIGTYTGNGTSQNIDCGFSTGARFILLRAISGSTLYWYVFDTVRGISASTDPLGYFGVTSFSENSSTSHIDPLTSGFSVTSSTSVNASGVNYLYLAFA